MATDGKRRDFGRIIRDELLRRADDDRPDWITPLGHPNFSAYLLEVDAIGYETARKALTGDRWPSNKVMEALAAPLELDPHDFWEYRLNLLRERLEPRDDYQAAYDALRELEASP
jgi:hypothetical protein